MDIAKNIEKIRAEFPILRYTTHLNSAARGPGLRRVWDAVQDCWNFRMTENRGAQTPDAKAEAAKLLHASPDEICYCARVTQGVNMAASMLEFEPGENVVVTELGYPSNVFPWLPLKEKGVEIRRIKHKDGRIETADFEKAVDDKTRVVSFSHIEWTCGLLHDVKAITDIAHDHNAVVVDDAYQAVGAIDVDVHHDGLDFLTVGSEKWLCCPSFAGAFYIRKGLIDELEPTYRYYGKVEEAFRGGAPWSRPEHDNIADYEKPLGPTAEKFNRGCVAEDAIWGFHAALSYFNELGPENIEKRVRKLSGYLIDGLRELGVKVNTPLEPSERGGLVTYNTGKHELNVTSYNTLGQKGIHTALRYQQGVGGIRVSTHLFNTEEEIDRLLKVQRGLLK
jgi:cysteine desulfurase/selenocysteine lyase